MSQRAVTCPHCFRDVSVRADGICPACTRNTSEKIRAIEDFGQAEFVDGEKLPFVCLACGGTATCSVVVGEKNETEQKDAVFFVSRLLAGLGGLFAVQSRPEATVNKYKISVAVPLCEEHKSSPMLDPLHVDCSRYRITLPAHKKFIEIWRSGRTRT